MSRQMTRLRPDYHVALARSEAEIRAAQRLRYRVFVEELGGDGPGVDHAAGIETDPFDASSEHLILRDPGRAAGDQVVGVYRLMTDRGAAQGPGFYTAGEYDLSVLHASGRPMMELGRSCLHPDYRGGDAMFHLWQGLSRIVEARGIEILFGVASFHGTDTARIAGALSLLHHEHGAPPELRVRSLAPAAMDILPPERIDRLAALRDIPALIKAYLRLGGVVGEGAYIDRAFNTTDVCLVVDTARLTERQRRIYAPGPG